MKRKAFSVPRNHDFEHDSIGCLGCFEREHAEKERLKTLLYRAVTLSIASSDAERLAFRNDCFAEPALAPIKAVTP